MAQCFTPLQVCAVVATKLAANGAPDPGLQSVYVSDKFVTMNRAVEREEGQRIQLRSGCGVPIVDFRDGRRRLLGHIQYDDVLDFYRRERREQGAEAGLRPTS